MPTELSAARNGRTNATDAADAHETDESAIETERDDVAAGRSLVVLDPDHPETSLRAAFEHLDASDGALDLLVVYPMERFEARREELLEAGATAPYAVSDLETEARRVAWRTGHDWLAPLGVEFEAIGAVGRVRDCVRLIADDRGCARVYVESPRRTRWQRLRGVADRATALDGALPGTVTVVSIDGDAEPGVTVPDVDVDTEVAVVPDASVEK
jgi:hypothetical protein